MSGTAYRIIFLIFFMAAGFWAGPLLMDFDQARLVGPGSGLLTFLVVYLVERVVRRTPPHLCWGARPG